MPQSNYSCQQKDKSSSPHNEQLPVMYHDYTRFITILYLQPLQDKNNSAASII